ncbi:serine hydrolase [Bradyrhizobium sacchari]|uniref:serine hydrolase n=1 Tax=Bradyrhizobium sacchari TaxID=1399419 RepID=UPI003D3100B4
MARLYPDFATPPLRGDKQAFIEAITKLPLTHQPGTEFEYGFSTDVLRAVGERVSEQRLGDYLAGNLWKPIEMQDATFHLSESQRERFARPFSCAPPYGKTTRHRASSKAKLSLTAGELAHLGPSVTTCAWTNAAQRRGARWAAHSWSEDGAPHGLQHIGPGIKNRVANVEAHRAASASGSEWLYA